MGKIYHMTKTIEVDVSLETIYNQDPNTVVCATCHQRYTLTPESVEEEPYIGEYVKNSQDVKVFICRECYLHVEAHAIKTVRSIQLEKIEDR